jgi:hypothetical protein
MQRLKVRKNHCVLFFQAEGVDIRNRASSRSAKCVSSCLVNENPVLSSSLYVFRNFTRAREYLDTRSN